MLIFLILIYIIAAFMLMIFIGKFIHIGKGPKFNREFTHDEMDKIEIKARSRRP